MKTPATASKTPVSSPPSGVEDLACRRWWAGGDVCVGGDGICGSGGHSAVVEAPSQGTSVCCREQVSSFRLSHVVVQTVVLQASCCCRARVVNPLSEGALLEGASNAIVEQK